MVYRQPFPGPGLGVRCLGAITRDRLEIVRESDAILATSSRRPAWPARSGSTSPPCRTSSQWACAITRVASSIRLSSAPSTPWDAMTATVEQVPWPLLLKITDRILAEVKGCNRVVYDLSPKPVATIEWE